MGDECDVKSGPCACGAWHTLDGGSSNYAPFVSAKARHFPEPESDMVVYHKTPKRRLVVVSVNADDVIFGGVYMSRLCWDSDYLGIMKCAPA
jgi:hypothetical protein